MQIEAVVRWAVQLPDRPRQMLAATRAPPIPARGGYYRRAACMAVGIRVRRWERQRAWGQGPGQLSFSKFRRLFGIGIIVEIAGGAFRAGAASGCVANVLDRSLSLGTCAF